MNEILVRRVGETGRVTLNRPQALNALTHGMVKIMAEKLEQWRNDDRIKLIFVDGTGSRGFCAGGDIVMLYQTGRETPELGRSFWRDEYQLNLVISRYPKPYVVLMEGIVMGGGIGLSAHGSHRVVTEMSMLALPEASIGFMPDVGSTWLMARAPGKLGEYIGATGARLNGADAIYAGFADHYVRSAQLSNVSLALESEADPEAIVEFFEPKPVSELEKHAAEIEQIFDGSPVPEMLKRLDAMPGEFAAKTAAAIRRNSPLSVAATLEAIRRARSASSLAECLAIEYRFAHRCLEGHDFYEGVRAAVIDKDKSPRWNPADHAMIDKAMVDAALAPLGAEEWTATA